MSNMATKEEERQALKKIHSLIDGLGEGSYLSTAFDGCFEDAEKNIEDDAAYSMKSRYEKASSDAEYFKKAADEYLANARSMEDRCHLLEKNAFSKEELKTILGIIQEYVNDRALDMDECTQKFADICNDPSIDVKKADLLTPLVDTYRFAKEAMGKAENVYTRIKEILRNLE